MSYMVGNSLSIVTHIVPGKGKRSGLQGKGTTGSFTYGMFQILHHVCLPLAKSNLYFLAIIKLPS